MRYILCAWLLFVICHERGRTGNVFLRYWRERTEDRGPLPVTGDTCAFFFVDIYFTVVSRFLNESRAVRRGPPAVSHNSSYGARRKCPGRFRITLKPFHPRDRESAISMLTRALSITLLGTRPLSNHPCWPFQLLLSLGLISLFCIIEDGLFAYFASLLLRRTNPS